MSSSVPADNSPSKPVFNGPDPRVDELLRRVAALEQQLATIQSTRAVAGQPQSTPAYFKPLSTTSVPPIAASVAPPIAEPHAAFIERLADFKRDARAERVAGTPAPAVGDVPAAAEGTLDSSFDTGEFEAIFPDATATPASSAPPLAPPTAPPTSAPDAPMPVIYASAAPYAAAASAPASASPAVYPPPVAPARTVPGTGSIVEVGGAVAPPRAPAPAAPPIATRPPLAQRPTHSTSKPNKPAMSLESLIGFKGFMFAGSIIVIIGVIMFFKLAIEREWFTFPPAFRCIAVAVFGAALLGAGEWARRKINALASAGLSAAGIATMYGAAYAAYGVFNIVEAPVGFVLLAAAAAIGIFVALRAGLVSVAIVSLLGAYLAPLIAQPDNPSTIVMPAYLFALLTLGLVLAARRPKPFRLLRGVVWWGTVTLGTYSVFYAAGQGQSLVGLGFLGLVWAAVHAELWYGARKSPEAIGAVDLKGLTWRATRPVLSTFATSMWATAIGVWAIKSATGGIMPYDWMVTGAFAISAGVMSMILAGNLRVLIDTPENDGERLGAALMAQSAALIVATVVLGLAGRAEVLAGIALGVAAIFAGRWIKSRGADVYGLIVLTLTVGRMVVYDSWNGSITGPRVLGDVFLGLSITEWTLLMCGAAAGWAAAGVLLVRSQAEGFWRSLGVTSIGIALAVGFTGFLSPHADAASIITLLMLVALAALGIGRVLNSRGMDIYAIAILAGAVTELVMFETQPFRDLSPTKPGTMILGLSLTRWTGLMLQAAAAWAIVGATLMRSDRSLPAGVWRRSGIACIGIALCVAFAAFVSPQAAAESLLVFSILFCVAAFGVGNALRSPIISGMSVAALAAASLIACVFQFMRPEAADWSWRAGGIVLSRWGMAMMLGALVWSAFAFVLRRAWAHIDFFKDLSVLAGVLAVAMLFGSFLAPGSAHGPVVWVWLVISLGVLAAHLIVSRMYLDLVAFAGLIAATGLWAITYAFSEWSVSARPVGLHPGLIQGLALAAAFWCGAGVLWKRIGKPGAPTIPDALRYAVATAVGVIFISTSLEVRRAALMWVEDQRGQKAALSIWWGVFGLGLIIAGFWRRVPIVRHTGLALMMIAVGKAIFFDLVDVPQGWRVASFLGLGLMMLGVGLGYAKAHVNFEKANKEPEEQPPPPDEPTV